MNVCLYCFFSAINKYSYFYLRDEVEVRRGPGGEAGGLEADDPQLHGEVRHGRRNRQQRRQRSSLVFGGRNSFNAMPHNILS